MMPLRVVFFLSLTALETLAGQPNASYVGPETCAVCHKDVAAQQTQSPMAKTWGGQASSAIPANLDARISEGAAAPVEYRVSRQGARLVYSTQSPHGDKVQFPIEIIMGGARHGMGFLIALQQIDNFPLSRPTLVQARYFWNSRQSAALLLAPGLSSEPPHSYETALGLVLSPSFGKQCLTCHGQPHTLGAGKLGGVRCESCHGPGSEHVAAMKTGQRSATGIINPHRLSSDRSIEICAQCHAGFGRHIDAAPDDLLIANQVQALRTSECFIQSGRSFSCASCHDPHSNVQDTDVAVRTCLGCHAKQLPRHAAVCPVNARSGCIGCHMPTVDVGPLHLVDHQIRVHPEQTIAAGAHDRTLRSQVPPVREYLRIIRNADREKLVQAKRRIEGGASFYDVARELSEDTTATIGGFLGDKEVASLEPALAPVAARLTYGEISDITESGRCWYLIQRLPRDFRWESEQIQREAETLLSRGDTGAAIRKSKEALQIYPHFRRAFTFIGTTLAQGGQLQRAADVLGITSRLYPDDAASLFDLAAVQGALNHHDEEVAAYRRALTLEPDFLAAYVKLGSVLDSIGDTKSAIAILRQGLDIDPLSADVYYQLSQASAHRGEIQDAKRYAAMAALLDPQYSTAP